MHIARLIIPAFALAAVSTFAAAQEPVYRAAIMGGFAQTCGASDGDRSQAAQAALAAGWQEIDVGQVLGAAAAVNFTNAYAVEQNGETLILAVGRLPDSSTPAGLREACVVYAYPTTEGGAVTDPRADLARWVGIDANTDASRPGEPSYVFVKDGQRRRTISGMSDGEMAPLVVAGGLHIVGALYAPQKSMISYLIGRYPQ